MATRSLRVVFLSTARADLEEINAYWVSREEPDRGAKYCHDLPTEAFRRLTDPTAARAGRKVPHSQLQEVQEIRVFGGSYRIIYRRKEEEGIVEVMRFWHSHRREPFS